MAKWPLWAKVLYGVFVAYSALLCAVATMALLESYRSGYGLKWQEGTMQALLMLFLPLLLLAFRSARVASGALLLLALGDAILMLTLNRSTGDGIAGMLVGSLIFLGLPVLGATVFLRRASKWSAA